MGEHQAHIFGITGINLGHECQDTFRQRTACVAYRNDISELIKNDYPTAYACITRITLFKRGELVYAALNLNASMTTFFTKILK